ncbi:helix-turn-helix domain-containing protein [Bacillus sp. NP157]|nr:helix-turn-helix domain-containing protein [Bacillus sp. NP157]
MATQRAPKIKPSLRARKTTYLPESAALWASFRHLRKSAGYSQEAFGERLKRNQSYVSAAENGIIRLDAIQIMEWAAAAGCTMGTWLEVFEGLLRAQRAVDKRTKAGNKR